MFKGLYVSEKKVYFRDQVDFYHYLYFDGSDGVLYMSGNSDSSRVLNTIKNSTKCLKGTVANKSGSITATIHRLSSGKSPSPDGKNVYRHQLSICPGDNVINVKFVGGQDIHEYSGRYKLIITG